MVIIYQLKDQIIRFMQFINRVITSKENTQQMAGQTGRHYQILVLALMHATE